MSVRFAKSRGGVLLMMLVIFSLMIVMLSASIAFINRQFKATVNQGLQEQAFYAAESGIQFTLFLLNSNVYTIPGLAQIGVIEHAVDDASREVGSAELSFVSLDNGGQLKVVSVGRDSSQQKCQAIIAIIDRTNLGANQQYVISSWNHLFSCGLVGITPAPTSPTPTPSSTPTATPTPTPTPTITPTPTPSVTPSPTPSVIPTGTPTPTPTPTPTTPPSPIIFTDVFSGTNGTELNLHLPSTGTSWTKLINVGSDGEIVLCGAAGTAGGYSACDGDPTNTSAGTLYTADVFGYATNYEVQVTAVDASSADEPLILAARVQDSGNMYAVRFTVAASSGQIYKKVSGTWTVLGTAFNGPASGSVVKFVVNGSTLSFYDDGVLMRSVTDTSITAAGKAGLGAGAVITATDDVDEQEFDDFRVTNL